MKQDAEELYNDPMQPISKDNLFREIEMAELDNRKNESLQAAEVFDKKTKTQKNKRWLEKNWRDNNKNAR